MVKVGMQGQNYVIIKTYERGFERLMLTPEEALEVADNLDEFLQIGQEPMSRRRRIDEQT